jgi:phosphoribosylaminoimidazole carboxylase (NCAIR synthetase)
VSVHGIASRMDDDRVRQNQLTIEHDVAVPRFIPFRIDTDLDAVVAELRTAVVKRAAKVKEPRRYIARRRTDSR